MKLFKALGLGLLASALAIITGFIAGLLAVTFSLVRNGRVDIGYVAFLVAIGFAGSLIWSNPPIVQRNSPAPDALPLSRPAGRPIISKDADQVRPEDQ